MSDFLMREISEEEIVDGMLIRVSRTRTSTGFSSIHVTVGDTKLSFSDDEGKRRDEQQARSLARALDKIIDNPCKLPTA